MHKQAAGYYSSWLLQCNHKAGEKWGKWIGYHPQSYHSPNPQQRDGPTWAPSERSLNQEGKWRDLRKSRLNNGIRQNTQHLPPVGRHALNPGVKEAHLDVQRAAKWRLFTGALRPQAKDGLQKIKLVQQFPRLFTQLFMQYQGNPVHKLARWQERLVAVAEWYKASHATKNTGKENTIWCTCSFKSLPISQLADFAMLCTYCIWFTRFQGQMKLLGSFDLTCGTDTSCGSSKS